MFFYDKKHLTFNCWYNWRNSIYIPKPHFWIFSIGFFDKTPAHLVFGNLYLSKEKCFINCGFVIRLFGGYFFNQFRRDLFYVRTKQFFDRSYFLYNLFYKKF